MKLKLSATIIFHFLIVLSAKAQYIVGSYNLRLDTDSDKENSWPNRANSVNNLIRFHDFDILGTQEGFHHQLNNIINSLPFYAIYGKGRDDGFNKGEHSAILYKKDKFELIDKGDFWLSQTPEKASKGWDAKCCNRICSWVYLKDKKTKKQFYVFNSHYDHEGVIARKNSSLLILEKIKSIAKNKPAILMGDLNGNHTSDPYLIIGKSNILRDAYKLVPYPYAPSSSYNNFGRNITKDIDVIDHLFVSQHFEVNKWGMLTDTYQGKYPSDHFPILTELLLKKN